MSKSIIFLFQLLNVKINKENIEEKFSRANTVREAGERKEVIWEESCFFKCYSGNDILEKRFNWKQYCYNVPQQYSQTLNEEEFVAFYYSLLERPELDTLFAEYTKETPGKMSPSDLLRFLQNEQKDGAAMVEECKEIIKYVPYLLLLDTCPTCLLLHHPNSWSIGTLNPQRTSHASAPKDLCISSPSATCR